MRKRTTDEKPGAYKEETPEGGSSRRDFLTVSAVGLAAATVGSTALPAAAIPRVTPILDPDDGDGRGRTLLKGGVVLTLEASGDFEKADVLIQGKKIVAIGPNLRVDNARVVDCRGTIVMPGFVTTHHHQYETIARSVIPEGLLQGAWPQESYGSVVQNIWTAGRIPGTTPGSFIWDIGRPSMDPEDVYISELVACLSQITEGITCGVDTSQASHTPEYTDAMIQGLVDSGARAVYQYSGGTNRSAQFPNQPYEHPGRSGDNSFGVGRIATTYFNSKDQLITLGLNAGPTPVVDPKTGVPQAYTGWQLAREFGASINNHNVGAPQTVINAAADPRNGTDWSDLTMVHCVRWQDNPVSQIGTNVKSTAWEIFRDRGGHASIANIIEMQMRHGAPPFQLALNHGILPSLSPDVDTNMTTDPFSLMRGAFTMQRSEANDIAFPSSNPTNIAPIPQLITSRQCIEMATIAGATSCRLQDKIGTLKVGKEADIVVLDARNINVTPMNNVPGTVVTMMNPRHVRDVFVAGKSVYRNGKLVGWNMEKLLRDVEKARERTLSRIRGPSLTGPLPAGNNSTGGSNYRPNYLGSCCYNGQNTSAPHYVLRP